MNFLITDVLCRQNLLKSLGGLVWKMRGDIFLPAGLEEMKNSGWSLPVFKNDTMS